MYWLNKPFRGIQLNKAHPLARGLVGCWSFNEGSGTKVNDCAKRTISTLQNGPTWDDNGILFDANLEHVQGPNGSLLQANGTVAFGYTYTVDTTYEYWVVLDDDYAEFSILGNGVTNMNWYINGSANVAIDANTNYLSADHSAMVFTWNATGNSRKFYFEGNFIEENATEFTWDAAGVADHDIRIGGRPGSTGRYAGGIIHWFYIYDRDLSADEIAWLSREPYAMFEPYFPIWALDHPSGAAAPAGVDDEIAYYMMYQQRARGR